MGNKYACLMIKSETWQKFAKLASEKKVETNELIATALLTFLRENMAGTEPALMKRKIKSVIKYVSELI